MVVTEKFTSQSYDICTVAIYGNNEPFFFGGHLILRTYFSDSSQTSIDIEKTSHFLSDTLFYETNKVIRNHFHDRYDEQREIVIEPAHILGEPYQFVFNTLAYPAKGDESNLTKLKLSDKSAKGLILVLKKKENGQITWLEEKEAHDIEHKLTDLLK